MNVFIVHKGWTWIHIPFPISFTINDISQLFITGLNSQWLTIKTLYYKCYIYEWKFGHWSHIHGAHIRGSCCMMDEYLEKWISLPFRKCFEKLHNKWKWASQRKMDGAWTLGSHGVASSPRGGKQGIYKDGPSIVGTSNDKWTWGKAFHLQMEVDEIVHPIVPNLVYCPTFLKSSVFIPDWTL